MRAVAASVSIARQAAQARDVEPEADLRRDAREELEVLGGVGFFRALLAEHQRADQRALLPEDRHQHRGAGLFQPVDLHRRQPPRRRSRIVQEDLQWIIRPAEHRHQAAVDRHRRDVAVARGDRDQPSLLDAGGQHRGDLGMERLVDLLDHHRREIAGVGLEADAAGQRHQDLPRVVFLAEEALVEPLARAHAVARHAERGDEEQEVDDRSAGDDLHQVLLDERVDQRRARQKRDRGERAVGQRVLKAAAQHQRRTEHARDADGVGQPERRQQHQQLQERGHRPGVGGHRRPHQHRDDRHAVLQRVRDDAGHRRVDGHPDAAPLVGVVIELVAIDAFAQREHVDAEGERERPVVDPRVGGVPQRDVAHRFDADEIERGRRREHQHRRRRHERHGLEPPVTFEQR